MKSFMQMYQLLEAATPAELIKLLQKGKGQQKPAAPQPAAAPSPTVAPQPAPAPAAATTPAAAPDYDDSDFELASNPKHDAFTNSLSPELQKSIEAVNTLTNDVFSSMHMLRNQLESLTYNLQGGDEYQQKVKRWVETMQKDVEDAYNTIQRHNTKIMVGEN